MTTRPTTVIDPVCGMTVDVGAADADGRIAEHEGRTYAFCRHGCRRAFLAEPAEFAAEAAAAAERATEPAETHRDHADDPGHEHAASDERGLGAPGVAGLGAVVPHLVIDEGMRRWYESCSCCLSDAYPDIKAALDAERAAAKEPPADPGICEVAEAAEAAAAPQAPLVPA